MSELLQLSVLLPWILAMLLGIFVGATPGLTATMAVALIVPISYHMSATAGLAMIIGVSFTAIFAGDIPATWLRIPGTPASAAATLDGFQLARKRRGNFALMIDLLCSSIGGIIGVATLIVIAPQLAKFALKFGDYEYFWLGVFGLSMSAMVTMGQTSKGLMAAVIGVLISTVGQDVVSNAHRYTFDNIDALAGLHFIPVMIGLFGVAEVLRNVQGEQTLGSSSGTGERTSFLSTIPEIWKRKWLVVKSALLGTIIGALPGAGADVAAWGAYGLAKTTSKDSEKFGTGAVDGVVAPTSANNAAVAGAWIPALVFGVPGDAVTAIVLGVLMVHGIRPGPMLFEEGGAQIQSIFSVALITQVLLIPCGWLGIRAFGLIQMLPRRVVLAAVLVFSTVGAYAINNSMFDVGVMVAFGIVGFFLEACLVPVVPLILGLILGPLVEEKLRAGLIASSGDFTPFLTRPICVCLIALLVLAFAGKPALRLLQRRKSES
ncbi:Tripartite tricarboxylate transporter TctA family protein [Thalassoglobus neptunius]|uniref:Tripartite tricarboxylate transporter TctA family protein n=1 Tax=Thalassoglobus neptunius TaxID=1938619 RepID=A0A5C5X2U0_9PLAN|nr:tripartite tricarboxylate transporter permease [Thalassoglobus neptunius]TWT56919.1 Tripartite tricarboxylate transporter TctA family protein [Thalassoglobus neptunius]